MIVMNKLHWKTFDKLTDQQLTNIRNKCFDVCDKAWYFLDTVFDITTDDDICYNIKILRCENDVDNPQNPIMEFNYDKYGTEGKYKWVCVDVCSGIDKTYKSKLTDAFNEQLKIELDALNDE